MSGLGAPFESANLLFNRYCGGAAIIIKHDCITILNGAPKEHPKEQPKAPVTLELRSQCDLKTQEIG